MVKRKLGGEVKGFKNVWQNIGCVWQDETYEDKNEVYYGWYSVDI